MFCKLNLKIECPPPYELLVWDYNKADTNSIRKALKQINCQFYFKIKMFMNQFLSYLECIL